MRKNGSYEGEKVDDGELKIYIEGYHIDFTKAQPVIINSLCHGYLCEKPVTIWAGEVNWQDPTR